MMYGPEDFDRFDAADRRAETDWAQAQAHAQDLANDRVARHSGDVLAALAAWEFDGQWRTTPDTFEQLVKDATRLELESRLNVAETLAWAVIRENTDEYTALHEAIGAKHRRRMMTTRELLRTAA